MHIIASVLVAALLGQASVRAHPGEDLHHEANLRRHYLSLQANNLDHCSEVFEAKGLHRRTVDRRAARVAELGGSLANLYARQAPKIPASHKGSQSYKPDTDPKVVFAGNNNCVLTPEVTEGPFFVQGEDIRSNIVEKEIGVPLHLDFQVIDVTTCKPLKDVYIELWNVNATGVYSGAVSPVNGVGGDTANLDRTFLRGVQKTDADGVVQFQTNFPGHYAGRATHIHLMTHLNGVPRDNNTMWDLSATYAGQLFFDQDLIDTITKLDPYSKNRQSKTKNTADSILLQETPTADPYIEYVTLGGDKIDLNKGLFGWYRLGVNPAHNRTVMAAAQRFKEGGKVKTGNPGAGALFPGGFPTYAPGIGSPAPTGTRG
ncbi:Intradiol ring-cleavage dioxygenase [Apodospora peruviana]|uniref:Intradiol ring-cleavage dioxygenase n=1 Tax=Apodospora peruviana TaxID=516989 RepID=A0AAE0IUH8_9PEZI|nr:Intradiol ring-cleavage dioxygenase [Apodospora peruviana]